MSVGKCACACAGGRLDGGRSKRQQEHSVGLAVGQQGAWQACKCAPSVSTCGALPACQPQPQPPTPPLALRCRRRGGRRRKPRRRRGGRRSCGHTRCGVGRAPSARWEARECRLSGLALLHCPARYPCCCRCKHHSALRYGVAHCFSLSPAFRMRRPPVYTFSSHPPAFGVQHPSCCLCILPPPLPPLAHLPSALALPLPARPAQTLMTAEHMVTTKELAEKYKSVEDYEDDFSECSPGGWGARAPVRVWCVYGGGGVG